MVSPSGAIYPPTPTQALQAAEAATSAAATAATLAGASSASSAAGAGGPAAYSYPAAGLSAATNYPYAAAGPLTKRMRVSGVPPLAPIAPPPGFPDKSTKDPEEETSDKEPSSVSNTWILPVAKDPKKFRAIPPWLADVEIKTIDRLITTWDYGTDAGKAPTWFNTATGIGHQNWFQLMEMGKGFEVNRRIGNQIRVLYVQLDIQCWSKYYHISSPHPAGPVANPTSISRWGLFHQESPVFIQDELDTNSAGPIWRCAAGTNGAHAPINLQFSANVRQLWEDTQMLPGFIFNPPTTSTANPGYFQSLDPSLPWVYHRRIFRHYNKVVTYYKLSNIPSKNGLLLYWRQSDGPQQESFMTTQHTPDLPGNLQIYSRIRFIDT